MKKNYSKNSNVQYTDLSYPDFYEDKILLIEYDLTPKGVFDIVTRKDNYFLICPTLQIEIKKLDDQQIRLFEFLIRKEILHRRIQLIIKIENKLIQANHNSKDSLHRSWSYSYKPGLNPGTFSLISYAQFTYKHPILLTWEEATDKSYVNFIVDSALMYLSKHRNIKFKNNNIKISINKL